MTDNVEDVITPPKLSVIIPVKNSNNHLRNLLESIKTYVPQDLNFETIIVDDGSDEDLAPLCAEFGAKRLALPRSQGPANARNVGAKAAQADQLFFLDADVLYAPGLFERARKEFDADPELMALSFISHAYDPRDGAMKNFNAAIEHYWCLEMLGGQQLATTLGFTTRNGAVRKAAFHHIQGFDTRYMTNAHEDYDFGKRLAAAFKVGLADSPNVYHNYPEYFRRIARNYFVRVSLFVPYYIKHKPPMDKAQTSSSEAMIRLLGPTVPFFAVLALLPIPGGLLWSLIALGCAGGYVYAIRHFLSFARKQSCSILFPIQCAAIHYATSIVISAGGLWGLYLHISRRDGQASTESPE